MRYCHEWLKLDEKHVISGSTCHTIKYVVAKYSHKECQVMVGSHLVLSKSNRIGDTKYNIYAPFPPDFSLA